MGIIEGDTRSSDYGSSDEWTRGNLCVLPVVNRE